MVKKSSTNQDLHKIESAYIAGGCMVLAFAVIVIAGIVQYYLPHGG